MFTKRNLQREHKRIEKVSHTVDTSNKKKSNDSYIEIPSELLFFKRTNFHSGRWKTVVNRSKRWTFQTFSKTVLYTRLPDTGRWKWLWRLGVGGHVRKKVSIRTTKMSQISYIPILQHIHSNIQSFQICTVQTRYLIGKVQKIKHSQILILRISSVIHKVIFLNWFSNWKRKDEELCYKF